MALFRDELDANVFLARLRKAAALFGVVIWAYTLMSNHFHLVVRASSRQLTRLMHHTQRMFSRFHNKRRGLRGHAFAGPYGAVRQSGPSMLVRTLGYVFMNPVTARQVGDPAEWEWSSYRSFMGAGSSRLWINALPLLGEIGPDIETARRKVSLEIEKSKAKLKDREPSREPTATEVHREHFEWMVESARELAPVLDGWDPIFLALWWARDVGIFRSAIAKVLGGPLDAARRSEFQNFRRWLARHPEVSARLRTA
jgi:REP element-mobilizing transposase RayT